MDLSKCRLKLKHLFDEQAKLLSVFMKRAPLVRGGVYQSKTKCGKKSCACAKTGKLHEVWRWYRNEDGTATTRTLRAEEVEGYEQYFRNYRYFRNARAALVKYSHQQLILIDRIEKGLEKQITSHAQRDRSRRG